MEEHNTLSMEDRKSLTRIVEHMVDDIMPYYVSVIRTANRHYKVTDETFWRNLFIKEGARQDPKTKAWFKNKWFVPLMEERGNTKLLPIPEDPYEHMDIQLCSKYLRFGEQRVAGWKNDIPNLVKDSKNFFRFVGMTDCEQTEFDTTLRNAITLRNSRKHETIASYKKMSLSNLAQDVETLSEMMEPFRRLSELPDNHAPVQTLYDRLQNQINDYLGGCPISVSALCKDILVDLSDVSNTRAGHIQKLLDMAGFRKDGDHVIVDCSPDLLTQAVLIYVQQNPGAPTEADVEKLKAFLHPSAEQLQEEAVPVCDPVKFSPQIQANLLKCERRLPLQENVVEALFRGFHVMADESIFLCSEGRQLLMDLIPMLKPLGLQLKLDYSVITALHLGYRRSKPLPLELLRIHGEDAEQVQQCQTEVHSNYKMALKALRRLRENNCMISVVSPMASRHSDENIRKVAATYPGEHFLIMSMHRHLIEKLSDLPGKNAVAVKALLGGKSLLLWGETYPMWQHALGIDGKSENAMPAPHPRAGSGKMDLPRIFSRLEAVDAAGASSFVVLQKKLGVGGEGAVFGTNHPTGLVAKIYHHNKLTPARREKLEYMVQHNPQIPNLAWPCAMLYDQQQQWVGYLMPKAPGKVLEDVVFHPGKHWKNIKDMGWSRRHLAQIGANISKTFALLHQKDMLMGDVNPRNIMVTEDCSVYFVDCDSYQFGGYECPVGKPDYTPPEVHKRMRKEGVTEYRYTRTEYNEIYSLAVLLFSILLPGRAPYAARNAGYSDVVDAVIAGYFPYPYGGDENAVPKGDMMAPAGVFRNIWSHMTWQMKTHFYETFTQTGASRRNAQQWEQALREYIRQIELNHSTDELEPMGYKETSRDSDDGATKMIDRVCKYCNQKYNIAEDVYLRRKGKFEQDFCGKHYQMMQNFRKRPIDIECSACGEKYQTNLYDLFVRDSTDTPPMCDSCENTTVVCFDCGISFRRNRRQVEELRRKGRNIVCPDCYNRRFNG